MTRRILSGVLICIDTNEADGTPLNDSPAEDRHMLEMRDDEDDREDMPVDRQTTVVPVGYLERQASLDRQRHAMLSNNSFARTKEV